MNFHRQLRCIIVWLGLTCVGLTAEVLPPSPEHYFNDYAGVVPTTTAEQLNAKLENFERTTSCQVVVAVFPTMQSASSLEDYTHRIATAWKIGQKGKNNGVGLFVFLQDRRMRIEVGYGMEGALPDALAKRIIEDEIKPFFKRGDYAGGLSAGTDAILQATRGEYRGQGITVAEQTLSPRVEAGIDLFARILSWLCFPLALVVFAIFAIFFSFYRPPRGTVYNRNSGSFWGGDGGGFSGGGFFGGGGSFGGGGASGSW
jgi:uncharacterized protein